MCEHQDLSLISELQKKLEGYFNYTTSNIDYVKILDTPNIWGEDFSEEIMPVASERTNEFIQETHDIIMKLEYRLDISSLNAPDEEWRKLLLDSIDLSLTKIRNRKQKVQIRFLFAHTPTSILYGLDSFLEGTPEYRALKKEVADLVNNRFSYWEVEPEIWIGRFYRFLDFADNEELELINKGLSADEDLFGKMTWNHTKIIAVDGYESLVGGHNLNMDLFKNYPPVHDVSVKTFGESAYASQIFLNEMWNAGEDLLEKQYYDILTKQWVNKSGKNGLPSDPLNPPNCDLSFKASQLSNSDSLKENGYNIATRVLSVGKYWTGPNIDSDYQSGSEIMKEFVIKKAKKLIRISQQDLISVWKKNWKDHKVCNWLIEALLANKELEVQIVVSPLDAAAGAFGDQYSFGSGAQRTYDLMKYYLTHDIYTDEILPDPSGVRQDAIKRIRVAPFYYTDKVDPSMWEEGTTYKWPNVNPAAFTATLKEPPLSAAPPIKGIISNPLSALIKGSGYFYPKVQPSPANHAKVTIIDDEIYIVGSDNLYPGYLSEFNFVIEGADAVSAFIKGYWEPLWNYSSPHIVS